jgi:hypothetical protein
MFKSDLLGLLHRWKAAGVEILLLGNFNKNVYTGPLALALASESLCLSKLCYRSTGTMLPPTHTCGSTPIDAAYCTSGILYTAVTLLPSQVGVGDHRVFLLDISLETILEDVFPCVISIASRLLNCASDKIRKNYILVLNQLANRHLVFKKLL